LVFPNRNRNRDPGFPVLGFPVPVSRFFLTPLVHTVLIIKEYLTTRVTTNTINAHLVCITVSKCYAALIFVLIGSINVVGLMFLVFSEMCDPSLCGTMSYLGSVWECVFKKIICVFKPNRNFGVFGIAILKTQILKS
jgi:hypothetical protein